MTKLNPKTALVVAAHPDDNEFCFGGTIAKWVEDGCQVHYLIVSDGRRGTQSPSPDNQELIAVRKSEQQAAADILGVSSVQTLDYEDGRLSPELNMKRDIAKKIREVRPDVLLCMDPTFFYNTEHSYINHNDHRAVGQAAFDAVYPLARDATAFDELLDFEPHKTQHLLMFNLGRENYYEDITGTFDKKVEAIKAHQSQFDAESKIEQYLHSMASKQAHDTEYELAEGFVHLEIFS